MYDPERSFGFLLHDCARLMRRNFERRARAIGLTRAQWAAIAHLRRNEGCNQSTLADLLEVEPITLARLLDRMEAAGWVKRRPDPKDRRARLVFLTEKAKPLIDQLTDFAADTRAVALAGMAPEEQEKAIDLMIRVRGNLSSRDLGGLEGAGRRAGAAEGPGQDDDAQADADAGAGPAVAGARRHG
jgi:DNA-binding MarR family transcriptional regulator